MTFEEILELITFSSLEVKRNHYGKHYVLHTTIYGSSPEFGTINEIRQWIEKNLGWQIVNKIRD
jgi:hypothetical protein